MTDTLIGSYVVRGTRINSVTGDIQTLPDSVMTVTAFNGCQIKVNGVQLKYNATDTIITPTQTTVRYLWVDASGASNPNFQSNLYFISSDSDSMNYQIFENTQGGANYYWNYTGSRR